MTIDRVFYGYMLLIGVLVGVILVAAPQLGDFVIKPYFWGLIAVALFEIGTALYRQNAPGAMLTVQARIIGFVIGIVLMVAIPSLAGSPVPFL
jgi:uncharacterized membrane protein HdeD (DUF308 family)